MTRRCVHVLLVLVFLLAGLVNLTSCRKKVPAESRDLWTLNQGISASFEDDGNHGFVLVLSGSGALQDFAQKEDAPWYSKSGRVSKIQIGEGITALGKNAFAAVSHVEEVLLPHSLVSIGSNAFLPNVTLYGYGSLENHSEAKVFLYSENQPSEEGNWWHSTEGRPVPWEKIRILFIGNSFTYYNDIDQLVERVAEGAGYVVKTDRIAIGAHNLTQFGDPKDEGGKQVEEYLAGFDYSYVVLQEQSTRPITGYQFFHDAAVALGGKIQESQPSAKVFLYSTWGFPKSQGSMTIPEMEKKIRDAYSAVAKDLGSGISPVGQAFTTVYERYPEVNLIAEDQQHPSYAGSFLSACVHVAALLGIDPRSSDFDGHLSSEQAKLLKEVAYETVFTLNK